jgi:hypothetical protein
MRYYAGLATRMQETEVFEATPGGACTFCEFQNQCDDAARADAGSHDLLLDDEWEGDLGEVEPEDL